MAKSLRKLKINKEWKQEEEHQKIFKELKDKITSQPVLALLKKEGKFRVETDTSGHAIGRVLFQEQKGKWKPIVFLSRTIQTAKRNYKIYNEKLLTIVEALTKQRQYLLNATEKFEVWTDYESLKYFQELYKPNRQQIEQYLKLQDYNFILWYIPGKINMRADILSRKDQMNTKGDKKNIKMLKEKLWIRRINTETEVIVFRGNQLVEETTLLGKIQRNMENSRTDLTRKL